MHKIIVSLFLTITSVATLHAQNWVNGSFGFEGQNRTFKTYHAAAAQQNMAVVIMLHGLGGSMNDVDLTNFTAIADTANLLLVSPQALSYTHPLLGNVGPAWNSGIKVTGTPLGDIELNPDVNDAGFLAALVDSIKANFAVDENRIFLCGFSNGGFMTQRMLCEQPGHFRAAASHSGTKALTLLQCSSTSIPVAHFHGTTDEVVDMNGTFYMGGMSAPVGLSADSLVNYWRLQNNAGTAAAPVIIGNQSANNYMTHHVYTGDKRVEYFKIENGTHTWYNFANTQNEFDQALETWNFFLRAEPKSVNIPGDKRNNLLTLYPNPATSTLYLDNKGSINYTKLAIMDLSGRKLVEKNYDPVLDIASLAPGIYILQIRDLAGKQRVLKFAKN